MAPPPPLGVVEFAAAVNRGGVSEKNALKRFCKIVRYERRIALGQNEREEDADDLNEEEESRPRKKFKESWMEDTANYAVPFVGTAVSSAGDTGKAVAGEWPTGLLKAYLEKSPKAVELTKAPTISSPHLMALAELVTAATTLDRLRGDSDADDVSPDPPFVSALTSRMAQIIDKGSATFASSPERWEFLSRLWCTTRTARSAILANIPKAKITWDKTPTILFAATMVSSGTQFPVEMIQTASQKVEWNEETKDASKRFWSALLSWLDKEPQRFLVSKNLFQKLIGALKGCHEARQLFFWLLQDAKSQLRSDRHQQLLVFGLTSLLASSGQVGRALEVLLNVVRAEPQKLLASVLRNLQLSLSSSWDFSIKIHAITKLLVLALDYNEFDPVQLIPRGFNAQLVRKVIVTRSAFNSLIVLQILQTVILLFRNVDARKNNKLVDISQATGKVVDLLPDAAAMLTFCRSLDPSEFDQHLLLKSMCEVMSHAFRIHRTFPLLNWSKAVLPIELLSRWSDVAQVAVLQLTEVMVLSPAQNFADDALFSVLNATFPLVLRASSERVSKCARSLLTQIIECASTQHGSMEASSSREWDFWMDTMRVDCVETFVNVVKQTINSPVHAILSWARHFRSKSESNTVPQLCISPILLTSINILSTAEEASSAFAGVVCQVCWSMIFFLQDSTDLACFLASRLSELQYPASKLRMMKKLQEHCLNLSQCNNIEDLIDYLDFSGNQEAHSLCQTQLERRMHALEHKLGTPSLHMLDFDESMNSVSHRLFVWLGRDKTPYVPLFLGLFSRVSLADTTASLSHQSEWFLGIVEQALASKSKCEQSLRLVFVLGGFADEALVVSLLDRLNTPTLKPETELGSLTCRLLERLRVVGPRQASTCKLVVSMWMRTPISTNPEVVASLEQFFVELRNDKVLATRLAFYLSSHEVDDVLKRCLRSSQVSYTVLLLDCCRYAPGIIQFFEKSLNDANAYKFDDHISLLLEWEWTVPDGLLRKWESSLVSRVSNALASMKPETEYRAFSLLYRSWEKLSVTKDVLCQAFSRYFEKVKTVKPTEWESISACAFNLRNQSTRFTFNYLQYLSQSFSTSMKRGDAPDCVLSSLSRSKVCLCEIQRLEGECTEESLTPIVVKFIKYGLRVSSRKAISEAAIDALTAAVSIPGISNTFVASCVEMLLSHSEFKKALVANNGILRRSILKTVDICTEKTGDELDKEAINSLLLIYQASPTEEDVLIRRILLRQQRDNDMPLQPRWEWFMNSFDRSRVQTTLMYFSIRGGLDSQPFLASNSHHDVDKAYCPTFLVPMLYFRLMDALGVDEKCSLDGIEDISPQAVSLCYGLCERGAIALLMILLCAKRDEMRDLTLACLGLFSIVISSSQSRSYSPWKDRPQQQMLIMCVQQGLILATKGDSSAQVPCLPAVSALFLARASLILQTPSHFMYTSINKAFLKNADNSGAFPDLFRIPLFVSLVSSASDEKGRMSQERVWALRLLHDGFLDKDCYRPLVSCHGSELLLSMLNNSMLRDFDGDKMQEAALILKTIVVILRRGGERCIEDFVRRIGVFQYLGGMLVSREHVLTSSFKTWTAFLHLLVLVLEKSISILSEVEISLCTGTKKLASRLAKSTLKVCESTNCDDMKVECASLTLTCIKGLSVGENLGVVETDDLYNLLRLKQDCSIMAHLSLKPSETPDLALDLCLTLLEMHTMTTYVKAIVELYEESIDKNHRMLQKLLHIRSLCCRRPETKADWIGCLKALVDRTIGENEEMELARSMLQKEIE